MMHRIDVELSTEQALGLADFLDEKEIEAASKLPEYSLAIEGALDADFERFALLWRYFYTFHFQPLPSKKLAEALRDSSRRRIDSGVRRSTVTIQMELVQGYRIARLIETFRRQRPMSYLLRRDMLEGLFTVLAHATSGKRGARSSKCDAQLVRPLLTKTRITTPLAENARLRLIAASANKSVT